VRRPWSPAATSIEPDDIPPLRIGLNAAIVAVTDRTPSILAVPASPGHGPADGLPFGPFDPARHRTFEASLRDSVEQQTALILAMSNSSTPLATVAATAGMTQPGMKTARIWSRSAIWR
jgi:hypothetical protein